MCIINVYLTNLGKYNEGELLGEWVELPITEEELTAVRDRIGINEFYEEVFLTDWESPFSEVNRIIGEFTSIEYLNEIAEQLSDIPECDYCIINALSDFLDDIDSIIKAYEDGEFRLYNDCYTMTEVAEVFLDETGAFANLPDFVERYFDFEAYGRDMEMEGCFSALDNGTYIEIFR